MSLWRNSVFFNLSQAPFGPYQQSAGPISHNIMKALTGLSLFLITMGTLVLLFPLILAFLVAALFFTIAAICLAIVWKLYRQSKIKYPPDYNTSEPYDCGY